MPRLSDQLAGWLSGWFVVDRSKNNVSAFINKPATNICDHKRKQLEMRIKLDRMLHTAIMSGWRPV